MGGRSSLRSKIEYIIRGGKGRVIGALPFYLFPSVIINSKINLSLQIRRCNVDWVGRVLVLTFPIILNGPPLNSSFEAGAYE